MHGVAARAGAQTGGALATAVAYGYAFVMCLVLAHFLLAIPVQFSDSFGNILKLSLSWSELIGGEFRQQAFLRPLLWAEFKAVHDLSGGNFAWFRGVHVGQLFAMVALYLALVRPRTWGDAAAIPLGLAVLVSIHTFPGAIAEAFPVNAFLTMVIYCFAAAIIALSRHRWWNDVLAVVLFAVAALTVESGLLVWVVFIGATLVGARGVSRAGLWTLVAALAGYFLLRFVVLDVGSPGLEERSSGFGFSRLEPEDLLARFGSNPLPFYLYNIVTSALSVLFGEPRNGVFGLTSAMRDGTPPAPAIVTVIATTSATVLIAMFAWRRRADWLRWQFTRDDRIVALFVMVLVANAVLSFPYTKDVVMSPAGAFMAAAAFVAVRHLLSTPLEALPWRRIVTMTAACGVASASWAILQVGLHALLRQQAHKVRVEWAYAEGTLKEEGRVLVAHERRVFQRMRDDALLPEGAPDLVLPLQRLMPKE